LILLNEWSVHNNKEEMAYKDFTQMTVWQKAFALLIKIYQITKSFPADERFGLISDMRRAANSAVHNISEGFGRFEVRDKSRFYKISRGSCYELISQLMAAERWDMPHHPRRLNLSFRVIVKPSTNWTH